MFAESPMLWHDSFSKQFQVGITTVNHSKTVHEALNLGEMQGPFVGALEILWKLCRDPIQLLEKRGGYLCHLFFGWIQL
jgi:hypothetical protein